MTHHDASPMVLLVYWLAALSNLGPLSIYLFVMYKTIGGLSVPRRAQRGSRNFFFGCAMAHLFMLLMLVAMPIGMMLHMMPTWIVWGLLVGHLGFNVQQ